MITDKTAKALTILRDKGRRHPGQFAELMWPDSEKWNVSYKVGNNASSKGAAMPRAAGAYLGRLKHRGLVAWNYDGTYTLVNAGFDALAEWEKAKK